MAKVSTTGLQQLAFEGDSRIRRLEDQSVYLQEIGEVLLGNRKKRFDDEAGPGGVAWEPLADSTVTGFLRPESRRGKATRAVQRAINRSGKRKVGSAVSRAAKDLRAKGQNVRQRQGILKELSQTLGITERQAGKTLRDRRGAGNILVRTGTLSALQLEVNVTGREGVTVGTPPAAEDYASTHQLGDASRGIPARPYMGFDDKDFADIERVREDFLDRVYGGDRA